MTVLVLVLVAALAFGNGANDNGKGVATLVGFGAARPGPALAWATGTTAVGAAASYALAGGLLGRFSTGLFAAGVTPGATVFAAVLVGAIAWVAVATWTGMPVSTTHAIVGGLLGAGVVAYGAGAIRWHLLAASVVAPLVVSPVVALAIVYAVAWPVAVMAGRGRGSAAATVVHWASGGLVGVARGWNDAAKIAAQGLLAVGGPRGVAISFAVVTAAMAAGGLVAGRRVLATLATKVTALPLAESLTASLTTAALVGAASWASLPVSTTQVSTGAIVGAGLKRDPAGVRWSKVGEIVLSWVVTVPAAGLVAAGVQWCIG